MAAVAQASARARAYSTPSCASTSCLISSISAWSSARRWSIARTRSPTADGTRSSMAMSGRVRLPSRRSAPIALPSRSWSATKSRASSEIWKATPMSRPYRVSASVGAGGRPPRRAPMRQHAEMNEAVFWLMIRM